MKANVQWFHCWDQDAINPEFYFGGVVGSLNMNVAGSSLHRTQQNRIEELDRWTLVFPCLVNGQDLLSTLVFLDQHRSVFCFQFAQRLTGPLAMLKGHQYGTSFTHDKIKWASEKKFQLIKRQKILRIGNRDRQAPLLLDHRHKGMSLHQFDRNGIIEARVDAKLRKGVERKPIL